MNVQPFISGVFLNKMLQQYPHDLCVMLGYQNALRQEHCLIEPSSFMWRGRFVKPLQTLYSYVLA
jgi:hypothetical protein